MARPPPERVHASDHYYGNADSELRAPEAVTAVVTRALRARDRSAEPTDRIESTYLRLLDEHLRTGRSPLPCKSLSANVYVAANGDVYPCTVWDHKLGNALDSRSPRSSRVRRPMRPAGSSPAIVARGAGARAKPTRRSLPPRPRASGAARGAGSAAVGGDVRGPPGDSPRTTVSRRIARADVEGLHRVVDDRLAAAVEARVEHGGRLASRREARMTCDRNEPSWRSDGLDAGRAVDVHATGDPFAGRPGWRRRSGSSTDSARGPRNSSPSSARRTGASGRQLSRPLCAFSRSRTTVVRRRGEDAPCPERPRTELRASAGHADEPTRGDPRGHGVGRSSSPPPRRRPAPRAPPRR